MQRIFLSALVLTSLLSGCSLISGLGNNLSNDDVIAGLKEALRVANDTTTTQTHEPGGYYTRVYAGVAIRVLWPQDAQNAKSILENNLGQAQLVEDVVYKMNQAAENAAITAKPIIWSAVTSMTISDGMAILQGDSVAATRYLRQRTYDGLLVAFKPKIDSVMTEVGVQQTWGTLASSYNQYASVYNLTQLPENQLKEMPTDISLYVTEKALDGLFTVVAQEEAKIRRDPLKRVTDILKRVFGSLDK